MKTFEKFVIRIFFSSIFLNFVILTSLNFQILNPSYLFNVFEKNNTYEKTATIFAQSLVTNPNLDASQKQALILLTQNIPPALVKQAVEQNLTRTLDFVHGKAEDVEIRLPTQQLGFSGENQSTSLLKNADPQLREQLNFIQGIGPRLLILWVIELGLLILLFLLYGKFVNPKKILGGYPLLISSGILLLILSLILKFLSFQISNSWAITGETSQKILFLYGVPLLSEIAFIWILIGFFVTLTGVVILLANKYGKP